MKNGRGKEIPEDAEFFDLEEKFLADDERLQISSIGTGSVLATLSAFSKKMGSTIVALVAFCLPSTRQSIQIQLRAEAKSAAVKADRDEFDLNTHKIKEFIKLSKELKKLGRPQEDNITRLIEIWMKELGTARPTPEQLELVATKDDDDEESDC